MTRFTPNPCCGDCVSALAVDGHPNEIACSAYLEYRPREESPCALFQARPHPHPPAEPEESQSTQPY